MVLFLTLMQHRHLHLTLFWFGPDFSAAVVHSKKKIDYPLTPHYKQAVYTVSFYPQNSDSSRDNFLANKIGGGIRKID